MQPRLTIAIPTVNRADLLGRAIESALAQTSTEIEVLVSDNGSTDETPAVIARYAGRGLRTFRHERTMTAARHGGFLFSQARGEFFLGLSDDDYLEPEFAAKVLALYDRHPELAFVYTGCFFHYQEIAVPAAVGPPIESGSAFMAAHYANRRQVAWCACVTRVRDLRAVGPQPDDRVLGDMFFWTKLAFMGPVGCVPEVLSHYSHYRRQNDNISHGTPPDVWARELQLLSSEVMEASRKAGADADYLASLRTASRRHLARSVANQFVWTRIRGAGMAEAWGWSLGCLPYMAWDPRALTRFCAGLVLPRALLRGAMLRGARKLSALRNGAAKPNG